MAHPSGSGVRPATIPELMPQLELPGKQADRPPDKRKTGFRAVAPFVLGALVAALAISNRDEVEVHWLVTTWRTPLVVLIVVSVVAGMLVGWLLGARRRRG